jgi:predicted RNA methylase
MPAPDPEILHSPRSGDAYNAHSYHTKVPAGAIAELIRRHLPSGGVVADAYCGSGSTGVAAALAELLLPPSQSYDVVLGDLSPYATSIAAGLNLAPDDAAFRLDSQQCIQSASDEIGALWATDHVDGRRGEILYTIWSEVIACPRCDLECRFWDQAVDLTKGEIRRILTCQCGHRFRKHEARRVTEKRFDAFINESVEAIVRVPVLIVYEVDGKRYEKKPSAADVAIARGSLELPAPDACPRRRMLNRAGPWGDLYRRGYHQGISHIHHFYTWRSFITLGHMWEASAATSSPEAVRLLISSYNLAHATLMSRVVFKRGNPRPVLTGYQTGALYISALPVEKNPLIGVARKRRALERAFALVRDRRGSVKVLTGAAQDWRDVTPRVDYAFVDPPFGANIPYAEASFIAEAWLGQFTDQIAEASMSKAQDKSATDYQLLLAEGFEALRGCMSRNSSMTVMFHSSASAPWNALTGALNDAGFQTNSVLLLDKRQASFKQVRSRDAVQGDVLIETTPRRSSAVLSTRHTADLDAWLRRSLATGDVPLDARTERALFSRYMAEQVHRGQSILTSAPEFYRAARQVAADILPAVA